MKYFYYLKSVDNEIVYQDEEVVLPPTEKQQLLERIASKEEVVETKQEIVAEMESHKIAIYDTKTEIKKEVDAKTADCLLRWDGSSPFYQVVKGISPEAIPFLGWPQISEENYVPPVEEPVPDVVEEVKEIPEVIIKEKTL